MGFYKNQIMVNIKNYRTPNPKPAGSQNCDPAILRFCDFAILRFCHPPSSANDQYPLVVMIKWSNT